MAKTFRKVALLGLIVVFAFVMVGCMTHEHIVGTGASAGLTESATQWYILGIVPLNEVDTRAMSEGATDYEIVTETSVLNAIIAGLTSGVLQARTVSVTR